MLFDPLRLGDVDAVTRIVRVPLTRNRASAGASEVPNARMAPHCAQRAYPATGGTADLVAFGRPFISNPDLGRRLREDAPMNELRPALLYGGGAEGYTDYPALAAAA